MINKFIEIPGRGLRILIANLVFVPLPPRPDRHPEETRASRGHRTGRIGNPATLRPPAVPPRSFSVEPRHRRSDGRLGQQDRSRHFPRPSSKGCTTNEAFLASEKTQRVRAVQSDDDYSYMEAVSVF